MELVKKEIHMNQMKGKIVTQITLDEDSQCAGYKTGCIADYS